MNDNVLAIIAAALVALLIGVFDALLLGFGLKGDAAVPSASDAWYD